MDKYTDFKKYVEKKLVKPMTITKEAGVFVCRKECIAIISIIW